MRDYILILLTYYLYIYIFIYLFIDFYNLLKKIKAQNKNIKYKIK